MLLSLGAKPSQLSFPEQFSETLALSDSLNGVSVSLSLYLQHIIADFGQSDTP